jgi:signal transduction histidine kinase
MARSIALPPSVWVSLADRQGNQLLNTGLDPGKPIPSYPLELEVTAALQRGETYISNFKVGALGRPILYVTMPVRGGSNVLGCVFESATFGQNFSLRRMAGKNWIVIIDRNGVIAARSRDPEKYIGRRASPDFWKTVSSRQEGVGKSVTLDGASVLTAFHRSELSGWTIINSAPLAEAHASARRLLLVAAVLSALLLVVAILLARWIGRGVVLGVNRLVTLASDIGRGALPKSCATGLAETDAIAYSLCVAGERLIAHERELRELNQSLEQRVSTRTSQLIATNRELAATNRELEEFARIAAHDLREPLRTISGFAASLSKDFTQELPTVARNYTDRISAAAQRMNRLLESVFEYSRLSTSSRRMERIDLNQVVDEVRDDLESRLKETGAEVRSNHLACLSGDPRQIHQLLLNLVGNALKFRRPGVSPVVDISTVEEPGQVRLLVSDNGVGFDPNLSERLFTPFHRLENANGFEGTGMGLAIVRRIAERHGGSVRAVSTPGSGSRFEVIFPVAGTPLVGQAAPLSPPRLDKTT